MTTVTQLLDHLIKAAGDMGKLKDPIPSTLIKARARIEHLEQRPGETETMRDRFALQLLPGIMADFRAITASMGTKLTTEDAISLAYHNADKVLEIRMRGSAEAPGETTSLENSSPAYKVGDQFKLRGEMVTIDEVITSPGHLTQYSWVFPEGRGSEGCYTAQEIADLQARYGDA